MIQSRRSSERGNATLKFLLTVVVIAFVAYAGYLYVPVALQAYQIKDLMQHQVDMAVAQGFKPDWVGAQMTKSAPEYGIPADAKIAATQRDGRVEVRIQFTKPIEFPGYVYQYEFDHTATSTSFLNIK
jgi:hypothetical protein